MNVFIYLLLIITSNLIHSHDVSSDTEHFLSKAEIKECLEEGYTELFNEIKEKARNKGKPNIKALPTYNAYQKIVMRVENTIEKGVFPSIKKGGKVAESFPDICHEIFRTSGFKRSIINFGGFSKEELETNPQIHEYITQKILYHLEVANAIEPILPTQDEKQLIQKQLSILKPHLFQIALKIFESFPKVIVEEAVEMSFRPFEMGPNSVRHSIAKRPLNSIQIDKIIENWNSLEQEKKEEFEKYKITLNSPRSHPKIQDVKKRNMVYRILRDYLKILDQAFDAHLPENFKIPEMPEFLKSFNRNRLKNEKPELYEIIFDAKETQKSMEKHCKQRWSLQ